MCGDPASYPVPQLNYCKVCHETVLGFQAVRSRRPPPHPLRYVCVFNVVLDKLNTL